MPKRRKQKKWYHSKTIWFNVIMTISGVTVVITPHIPERWAAFTMSIQGIGNLVLRVWFTSISIEDTESTADSPQETPIYPPYQE